MLPQVSPPLTGNERGASIQSPLQAHLGSVTELGLTCRPGQCGGDPAAGAVLTSGQSSGGAGGLRGRAGPWCVLADLDSASSVYLSLPMPVSYLEIRANMGDTVSLDAHVDLDTESGQGGLFSRSWTFASCF